MDVNIFSILSSLWSSFVSSSFFYYLKIVAGFVTAILLIADILLISKRARTDVKVAIYGANVPKFKKEKYRERWANIMKRVEEEGISGGKIALVEADRMFDEVLEQAGYKGKDVAEKLSQVPPGHLIGVNEVTLAHEISEKILFDPAYEIDQDEIREHLIAYERFFTGLEIY